MSYEDIENWFTYHAPDNVQLLDYQYLRTRGKELAHDFLSTVPAGAELEQAMNHLRMAIMWGNAGIACAGE